MKVFVVSGAYLNTGVFILWLGLQQDFPWGEGLTLLRGDEKGIRCVLYSVISALCCINDGVWTHLVIL